MMDELLLFSVTRIAQYSKPSGPVVELLTPLLRILEVAGSNLGLGTGYSG
jgi:hypothetical protein